MNANFVAMSAMEIQIRALKKRIESFESGSAYQKLKNEMSGACRTIQQLKEEIGNLKKTNVENVKKWMQVNDDVHAEKERELAEKDKEIERLQEALRKSEEEKAALKAEKQAALEEKYKALSDLKEANEKLAGLLAKYNKDSTNSSIPSSADPNHKKQRQNSRVPTGRHRGAQPGHEHHERGYLEPTTPPVFLPTPAEYLDTTKFKPTGEIVKKQLVSARLVLGVQEFQALEYRNLETGQRVHADFPYGLTNKVTYDGSVKALAYMLNNYCYTSIGKTRQFLLDASDGKLNLSTGFICELSQKFSKLSKEEQDAAWNALASAPVFHVDFTFGRCNGSTTTVAIVCDEDNNVVYQAKEKKGKEGVKGTPAEVNQGVCVSDHEAALIVLGSLHQECLAHVARYLLGSVQNEPNLLWNKLMLAVVFAIIEYRENMKPDEELDPVIVADLGKRFYQALEQGKIDYEENPPSKYYRDGYNLWKRMYEKPEEYIRTLYDKRVPPTNNDAERFAREYKRKVKQVMTFRSPEGHSDFCDGLTAIVQLRKKGGSLLDNIANVFNRALNQDSAPNTSNV